jgi:hypothetical protein
MGSLQPWWVTLTAQSNIFYGAADVFWLRFEYFKMIIVLYHKDAKY